MLKTGKEEDKIIELVTPPIEYERQKTTKALQTPHKVPSCPSKEIDDTDK